MSSHSLVDPELAPFLEVMPELDVSSAGLTSTRIVVAAMIEAGLADPDPGVTVNEYVAAGRNGNPPVGVRIYRPETLVENAPILLHLHGGGFVFGTAAFGEPKHRLWAKTLGCALASVDYRLAPEAAYPAALEDAYAALEWIHAEAPSFGLDRNRIAVSGESAGGALAAALCMLIRDHGGPKIVFQALIYPMLDDRTCVTDVANRMSGVFVWGPTANRHAWRSYLGIEPGSPGVAAYAAPARAADLAGLPPAFIGAAALDLFVDENIRYAQRLMQANVPVELYCLPGAFHGFDALVPAAAVSRRLTDAALNAVARAFAA